VDIFVSNTGSNDVAFYENTGGRQLTFDTRFGVGPDLFAVQLADVTGDGRLDLAGTVGLPPSGGPRALAVVRGVTSGTTAADPGTAAGGPRDAVVRLAVSPNPFAGRATLDLTVPSPQRVSVAAYDMVGRQVAVLHDAPLSAGVHRFAFDAEGLPAGVYMLRAAGATLTATVRASLVR
jgi:hypothetical protein